MSQRKAGPADILAAEESRLLACVHCGFCLSACPTYNRLGDEADSPRGRLHLMRTVIEGTLDPASPAFATHIDRCLGCRACEPVCPSGVQYGFLVERARTVVVQAQGPSPLGKLLLFAFGKRLTSSVVGLQGRLFRGAGLAAALARVAPKNLSSVRFGMAMLASTRPWAGLRAVPGSDRAAAGGPPERVVPPPRPAPPRAAPPVARTGMRADVGTHPERAAADPHALAGGYPEGTSLTEGPSPAELAAAPARRGPRVAPRRGPRAALPKGPRVAVLTGCVQEALFGRINRATERVLRVAGCQLVEVPDQQCCGALHAHGGALDDAYDYVRANIAAFERVAADYIVVNAAGCGAMMKEYGEQLEHDPAWAERAHALGKKVRDLNELLLELPLPRGGALELRVTYDAPCHLHHAQRITRAPLDLLARIPGLELVSLRNADECCGGAGIYGITHPELGGRILQDKIDALRETRADAVVTPNPGCMMQIGAGLLLQEVPMRVLHPIELLDESYRRAGLYG